VPGPNPFTHPKDWSRLTFFGKLPGGVVRLPGIITKIDGHDPIELWNVQKAQNSSYATTVWRGRLLNESIKIDIVLADVAAFDAYQIAKDRLQPKPPKNVDATSAALGGSTGNVQVWNVQNGALNFGGITRVGVRSVGTPRAQKDLSWTAQIDLIQYRPRVIAKVGPPAPPKQHKETENDRLAKELQDAIDTARKGKNLF
jgi:hypothetical protein